MDAVPRIECRVRSLERSLRRSRLVVATCALALVLTASLAMTPQVQEEVRTTRLVLTNASDSSAVVLMAGPESSLVVLTPDDEQVVRLGGPPLRRIH